ncbi:uncharacterized protein LOC142588636 [Dermacentor variabilis]|uniref:uncharacterized protein LOC142588636 n=1 Tax=Dermacentor variabilis TaxID=34621 RepID=UPI003F5C398D
MQDRLSKERRKRSFWAKTRCDVWWCRIVLEEFTDSDWRENFRMSRASFYELVSLMRDYMSPKSGWVRAPLPLEKRVAIALYKLASCCEYRNVANQFGVHKSTVKKCFYMFCRALTKYYLKTFIMLPSAQEATAIARNFELRCHLPQVFGAIDGTHIPITAPKKGYRDFVNRKGWTSYNVQAVVDDRGLFRSITCNVPGSAHDATVLKLSNLYRRSNDLLPQGERTLRGFQIPFMLLGDPAYPCLPWILKGYTGALSKEQESFNVYHSSGRNVVEHAFGRLKGRWRILLKRADTSYKFMPTVIAATCILHNFCEQRRESIADAWLSAVQDTEQNIYVQPSNSPQDRKAVYAMRDFLKQYMAEEFPLRSASW